MTTSNKQTIIALDGHDYSGKTTIALLLVKELKAKYVKPYSDSLGDMIAWLYRKSDFEFANKLAKASVEKVLSENCNEQCLVFDRLWLSMFTVFPEKYQKEWFPLQTTFLCWADFETSRKRMLERGEQERYNGQIEKYCRIYKELAAEFNVPVINTSGRSVPEEKVNEILFLINNKTGIK